MILAGLLVFAGLLAVASFFASIAVAVLEERAAREWAATFGGEPS